MSAFLTLMITPITQVTPNISEYPAYARSQGVVRTNCMDNLDRSNVVQSLFARYSVLRQFEQTSQVCACRSLLDRM